MKRILILVGLLAFMVVPFAYADPVSFGGSGSGDVTGVGTCTSGACLDGSSDGGTTISLYDGDSHKLTLDAPDISADITITLPSSTCTLLATDGDGSSLTNVDAATVDGESADAFEDADADILKRNEAEEISGYHEIADNTNFGFGGSTGTPNDPDIDFKWTTAAAAQSLADALMLFDSSGNAKFWFDPTNVSFGVAATATPESSLFDSDSATDDTNLVDKRADQYAGSISANMTTTTEDSETADFNINSMIGGTKVLVGEWDGSDEAWILGDSGTGEDLKFDFETATDNQVEISSNSGATAIILTGMTLDAAGVHTESTTATVTVSGNTGIYYNSDDDVIEFDLPAAASGKQFCFHGYSYARAITIDPDDSDQILLDGALETAGEAVVSTGAANDFICLHGKTDGVWVVWGSGGTWDGAVD